jgi:hypothetical protein
MRTSIDSSRQISSLASAIGTRSDVAGTSDRTAVLPSPDEATPRFSARRSGRSGSIRDADEHAWGESGVQVLHAVAPLEAS